MVMYMYYVNIFFIFSVLGFLFENFLNIFTNDNFNSGILFGPWTFIYGFGAFLIIILNKLYEKMEASIYFLCWYYDSYDFSRIYWWKFD